MYSCFGVNKNLVAVMVSFECQLSIVSIRLERKMDEELSSSGWPVSVCGGLS